MTASPGDAIPPVLLVGCGRMGGAMLAGWRERGLSASVAVNMGMFAWAFRILTARVVAMRDLLPGAAVAALGWQVLQTAGTTYLSQVVARSTDVYGGFGMVLGLFAWIYLGATVTIVAAEINVVRSCRLWPRSLTPAGSASPPSVRTP